MSDHRDALQEAIRKMHQRAYAFARMVYEQQRAYAFARMVYEQQRMTLVANRSRKP